ncbi:hypothetical protein U27_00011 [Candidatus Vecturithrix granuli]|uniref:Solute-binding protein family 3/N-terminal domain-containing protein n=1 Tax=Vecturithrix granuli TaxID=1499967 RepID=A0A081C6B5_VECG1|nr:hypothetical protein U27_00011 [Candidatus Vecturithrix granuli]
MKQYVKAAVLMTFCVVAGIHALPIWAAAPEELLVVHTRSLRGTSSNYDETKEYKYQLLQLILEKTEKTDGPFKIEVPKQELPQARDIELLKQSYFDVLLTMTSKEREQELHPIRIPTNKGLYGYRLAIINESDQPKFSAIRTLSDFQTLWAGQNESWPDTQILRANGFNVVGTSGYNELFTMLKERRFDFFPRGVHEPWKELADVKIPGLVVETDLVIHYPAPGYIFTNKDNLKLADRLERGFRMAIDDGSFDRFFYNHPEIKNVLERANLKNRRIFELTNPLLPEETPLDDKRLWYTP